MTNRLTGTGVALVTPFRDNSIDFAALKNIINHQIEGGVDFLVVLGTTGETPTLTHKEQFDVLDFCTKINDGRVGMVAGFGSYDTRFIINRINAYSFDGYDAILSASPAYNKPTQEGIFQHFMAIQEQSPVPIILYNVPGRTASNMHAETTLRLAEASKKFISIKEASGDLGQCMEIINNAPEGFDLLSGDDALTLPLVSIGAKGIISVISNAYPRIFSQLVRAALDNDWSTAKEIHYAMLNSMNLIFKDGNPSGIKGIMSHLGLCTTDVRLPLVPLTAPTQAALIKEYETLKPHIFATSMT